MKQIRFTLAAATVMLIAAPVAAQEPGSRQTREFVQMAAQSDQFEILEAETALTQSRNGEIRAFATRMLDDHRQTSQALKDAAARSGLKPPEMTLGDDLSHMLGALQSLTGDQFDKTYAKQQALAHQSALATEHLYASSGDDPNLRAVAASGAQLIQMHADMAAQLAAKFGGD